MSDSPSDNGGSAPKSPRRRAGRPARNPAGITPDSLPDDDLLSAAEGAAAAAGDDDEAPPPDAAAAIAKRPVMLLVDGSSYLYRAYHALPDLRGPDDFPTGALHGMVSMMRRLREQFPAEHAACVFDAPGATFRDELYADYKATRSAMPDALVQQVEPIREVVGLLGWPVMAVPGIEADDAIGTLARTAVAAGHDVVVSTGDKDLAQLVNEHVTLVNTMSNERLDIAGVEAKFGVPPGRIVDFLTLVGDAVDNVPGVDKVGPKTAAKWIAEHGSLDGVIAAAPTMKGAAGENLRKALDWLPQGRRLVTVKTDCALVEHVPGWPALEALALREVDREGLLAFFTRYGFKSWRTDLEAELGTAPDRKAAARASAVVAPPSVGEGGDTDATAASSSSPAAPAQVAETRYETVLTPEALDRWLAKIDAASAAGRIVALDTETDSLDALQARILGISFSVEPGEAAYIPLGHTYAGAPDQLPLDDVLAKLKPWLEDETKPKLGQHVKYDTHVFTNAGIAVRGYVHDTMLESYVLEAHEKHGLETLALRHLGRSGLSYEDVCGKGVHKIPFSQVAVETASQYACEDSDLCLHVHQVLWPRLEAAPRLRELYERIEMPTAGLLARIERNGVLIDAERLAVQSRQLAERMLTLETEAFDLAGQPFNLGSPKQIGEILFGKLGLPIGRRTAAGAPSTDESELERLAADYPLPKKLLEHRSLSKLKGTYTDKLPQMVNPATGRVHTNYAQAVAVTGRLSSNEPNLQNIPIRTPEGRRVREAFVAPEGHVIVSADYSQIELRLMAHISGDEGLLHAFTAGIDVHRATASEVFDVALDAVSAEQRRYAKTINFGLIYGMSSFGLSAQLGIDQKAARDYIEKYFARYPGVKRYMDDTRADAYAKGYVETVFGRRLYLPELRGGSSPRRGAAERLAINAPMQGTAADIVKLAMIAVQHGLDREAKATKMVLQVHDELVFEVPEAEIPWVKEAVPRLMAGVAALKVPLLAEVGVGRNWEEAH